LKSGQLALYQARALAEHWGLGLGPGMQSTQPLAGQVYLEEEGMVVMAWVKLLPSGVVQVAG